MNYRTLLAVVSVALVPFCVQAQEMNRGYDKTEPIVLTVDQEYAGSTDADRERKYFMAHVEPGVEYRIDLTGLSVDLDLYYKGSDATFLRDSLAQSTNADDNDERIQFTPKADAAYFVLHNYDFKESEFRILLTRSKAYLDEVQALSPIYLDGEVSYEGQVGTRSSLYQIGNLAVGATYRIAVTGLQVDADLFVFSDPQYREELARSSKRYTEDEFVTVSHLRRGAVRRGARAPPLVGDAIYLDRGRARSAPRPGLRAGADGDPGRRGSSCASGRRPELLLLLFRARRTLHHQAVVADHGRRPLCTRR